jgi:hypothetical protein
VGPSRSWPDAALTTFIVVGAVLLIVAAVEVFPRGSIKEGILEWPEVDKRPRVETLEREVSQSRTQIADTIRRNTRP